MTWVATLVYSPSVVFSGERGSSLALTSVVGLEELEEQVFSGSSEMSFEAAGEGALGMQP